MTNDFFHMFYQKSLRDLYFYGEASPAFLFNDVCIDKFYKNGTENYSREWCVDVIDFFYRIFVLGFAEFTSFSFQLDSSSKEMNTLQDLAKKNPNSFEGSVWYLYEVKIINRGKIFLDKFDLLSPDTADIDIPFSIEFKKEFEKKCNKKNIGLKRKELIKVQF